MGNQGLRGGGLHHVAANGEMLAVISRRGHALPLVTEIGQGRANALAAGARGAAGVGLEGPKNAFGPIVGLFEQDSEAGKFSLAPGRALAPDGVTPRFEVLTKEGIARQRVCNGKIEARSASTAGYG